MDINLGRGNSNLLLFRFLKANAAALELRLASINGGSLRNAIPRESFAVVTVPQAKAEALSQKVKEFESIYKAELQLTEPDLQFFTEEAEVPVQVMDKDLQARLINAIVACPNGVIRMSDAMAGTVETSNNLALIQSKDNKVVVNTLMRSFVETAKEALAESLDAVFELAKADKIVFDGAYPGWKPNPDSAILKLMKETYQKMYGKEPQVMAIHAGLECGILGSKYENWDMISFGPTICHPHSPDEKVNIASVGKFWDYLKETLKNIPVK